MHDQSSSFEDLLEQKKDDLKLVADTQIHGASDHKPC